MQASIGECQLSGGSLGPRHQPSMSELAHRVAGDSSALSVLQNHQRAQTVDCAPQWEIEERVNAVSRPRRCPGALRICRPVAMADDPSSTDLVAATRQDGCDVPVSGSCVAVSKHSYSITSSARDSNDVTSKFIARAVFKLMTSRNWSTCSTGRSDGLAPLKIRSTNEAARRQLPRMS